MPKEANKKQDSKKQSKDKKQFGKDFKAELKRVIWPTPKQLFNNTVAVITVVLITAAIVFVLDFAFESLNTYGVDRLKEMVENQNTVSTNTTVENEIEANTTTDSNSTNESANATEEANVTEENNVPEEDSNSVE